MTPTHTARTPVRVLLVGPSLAILGGQAVQAQRLRGLLETVPDLEVAFLPVNPTLPGPLGLLQRVRYVRTVVTTGAYLVSLVPAVRRADVVHAFSAGYWSFLLAPTPALLMGRLFRRGVVLNYRTGEAEDHLHRHGWFATRLMRLADAIVVPSGFLVEVFRRHGLSATAIANVVDTGAIPRRARAAIAPRLLSNRNLEPHYNVACILRAFARIQAAVPTATLTVAGHGSEASALRQLAAQLDLRNVSFTGPVAPEAMGRLYDAADIYLNAPDVDNMPTSVLEAFAAGLPVVTTSSGGIPWIVDHERNGLLVATNDDAAMADAALRLLADPALVGSLTAAARADVESKYTWPAVQPQWLTLYRGLTTGVTAA